MDKEVYNQYLICSVYVSNLGNSWVCRAGWGQTREGKDGGGRMMAKRKRNENRFITIICTKTKTL
jgi:hypothetical protein